MLRWLRQKLGLAKEPALCVPVERQSGAPLPQPERKQSEPPRPTERYVVIDCETTGLSPIAGDRVVSLAAIELVGSVPSGKGVSLLFNPGRKSHPRALQVHGLQDHVLRHQRPFSEYATQIADFVSGATLVGHNIEFDIGFLNCEFALCGFPTLHNKTICTMEYYRRLNAGRASLDAAATRFAIDIGARAKHHGAFVDANITSQLFQVMILGSDRVYSARHIDPTNYIEPPPQGHPSTIKAPATTSLPTGIAGISFAFTGELDAVARHDAVDAIEAAGGVWHRNVRKDTDFLVVGDAPGSTKLDTAAARRAKYGKPEIIDEDYFLAMLSNAGVKD